MKYTLIESVKYYSKVMLDKKIKVVDRFDFDKCKTSSIIIETNYKLKFIINIEESSLEALSNKLFGFCEDELRVDLQKELVNTIGGHFADKYFKKDYKLSLPHIDDICDTKNGIFFENDILKICARLKVE